MYLCEECDLSFAKWQLKSNHIRWHHNGFNKQQYKERQQIARSKSLERKFGKVIYEVVKCDRLSGCNNPIQIQYRKGKRKNKYYCGHSCANARNNKWSDDRKAEHIRKLMDPNIDYCEGFRKAMGNVNNSKIFSSKNERYIVKYFKEYYNKDEWKSGGGTKINGIQICRDLWSDKLRICFEYDGIWHFKDIHGQLQNKQLKDHLLEKWCLENDYRLIRIDEDEYKNINQIIDLIYNKSDQIIKIGNRYIN